MHWIINSLAFVGTLALAAIAIFVWACWRDATKQHPRPRQTRPSDSAGRRGSGKTSGAAAGRYPHSGGAGNAGWLASRRTARALRHQQRQAWDQAMRVKQAQDLAAFYAALTMAEEAGRVQRVLREPGAPQPTRGKNCQNDGGGSQEDRNGRDERNGREEDGQEKPKQRRWWA